MIAAFLLILAILAAVIAAVQNTVRFLAVAVALIAFALLLPHVGIH